MPEGTVKFFNSSKGFGFIKGDDDNEYYVHVDELEHGARLNEGDKVSFEIATGPKGQKASQVKKL